MKNYANTVEGSYSYTVSAEAEGGATATADGTMVIAAVCTATVVDSWNGRAISFNIPATDSTTETFPEGGATDPVNGYVAAAPAGEGCTQTFSVVALDPSTGAELNSPFIRDLTLDSETGVFTLTNRASEFFS
jgi:hypothetical protein